MTIYELLKSKQKKRNSFYQSDEYSFFLNNKVYMTKFPKYALLCESGDEFDVMRVNILLYGYLNKKMIEEEILSLNKYSSVGQKIDHNKVINTIKEKMIDMPYFMDDKNKIYIPFFSRSLNQLYLKEPEKLLIAPYNDLKVNFEDTVVDAFDSYGANLYDSLFTRLLKIMTNGREVAYFHYDTNTIYIVNDQGRMDCKIVLFDKYIKNPSFNHMIERIRPVCEAYFADDRSALINALFDNGFISSKFISLLNKINNKK